MELNEIKALAEKIHTKLTAKDKKAIEALAKEYGVTIRSTSCRNCYQDAMVQIYQRAKYKVNGEPTGASVSGAYYYKKTTPTAVQGLGIFDATTPMAKAMALKVTDPKMFAELYAMRPRHIKHTEAVKEAEPTPEAPEETPTETTTDETTTEVAENEDTDPEE